MTKVKFDRDSDGGREALDMGNGSINIWDGSELELGWSKKSSWYFEKKLPVFSLYFEYIDF